MIHQSENISERDEFRSASRPGKPQASPSNPRIPEIGELRTYAADQCFSTTERLGTVSILHRIVFYSFFLPRHSVAEARKSGDFHFCVVQSTMRASHPKVMFMRYLRNWVVNARNSTREHPHTALAIVNFLWASSTDVFCSCRESLFGSMDSTFNCRN
jgi:hypothetical protein